MKNNLVSIVIPVYNVEKYLAEALGSAVNQTYQNTEIICVNDGSTDNSAEILKEYAKQDTRIKIITQENQGLSAARNTGLSSANGEYIYFLDSDDILKPDLIEKTVTLFSDDVDIITFNLEKIYEIDERFDERIYLESDRGVHCINEKIFETILEESTRNIFKNSIIKKYNITFPEKLIYEDTSFILNYLSAANKIYILPEKLYKYRIRHNSIMYSNNRTNKIGHRLKNLSHYENFLKNNNLEHKDNINEFIYKIVARFYMDMTECGKTFKSRYLTCKEAHNLIKHYIINPKSKYLKEHEVFILNFLKSSFWPVFPIYYKLNFIAHRLLCYKHSHKLL